MICICFKKVAISLIFRNLKSFDNDHLKLMYNTYQTKPKQIQTKTALTRLNKYNFTKLAAPTLILSPPPQNHNKNKEVIVACLGFIQGAQNTPNSFIQRAFVGHLLCVPHWEKR